MTVQRRHRKGFCRVHVLGWERHEKKMIVSKPVVAEAVGWSGRNAWILPLRKTSLAV